MQRLKTRSQYQAVLGGPTVARTAHFAMHCRDRDQTRDPNGTPPESVAALGALVPKRWAKRAVTRNAVRRQIYEAGRRFEDSLPTNDYVVRLRAKFDQSQFKSAVSTSLKQLIRSELDALFLRTSEISKAGRK